ncbi:unnamed protein product, partial [Ixodes hexagonus]
MLHNWFPFVVAKDTVQSVLDLKNISDRLETTCLLFQLVINALIYTSADVMYHEYCVRYKTLWRNAGVVSRFWSHELKDYLKTLVVFNSAIFSAIIELDYDKYKVVADAYLARLVSGKVSHTRAALDPFALMKSVVLDQLFQSLLVIVTNTLLYDEYIRRELTTPMRPSGYSSLLRANQERNSGRVVNFDDRLNYLFATTQQQRRPDHTTYATIEDLRADRRRLYKHNDTIDGSLSASVSLNTTVQHIIAKNGSFAHLFNYEDYEANYLQRVVTMHMLRVAVSYDNCIEIVLNTPMVTERGMVRGDAGVDPAEASTGVPGGMDGFATAMAYATSASQINFGEPKLYTEMVHAITTHIVCMSMRLSEV